MQGLRKSALWAVIAAVFLSCTARHREGEECVFNDDCDDPLVCAARSCRLACRDSHDCVTGWKCADLHQGTRRVCVPSEHPDFCQFHSDCASPQACGFDGLCRYQCRAARDCTDFNVGLRCELDAGLCLWPQEATSP